jgi:hypothetical protein
MTDLPEVAVIPAPIQDPDKEAAIRAATYYDRVEIERAEQRRFLEQAKIALEVQLHRNADLQKQLDGERRMHESTQQLLNQKIQDCADLEATLAVEQDHHEDRAARLSRFEFSRLRKRNGRPKRNGDTVPDDTGSTVEVALDASVLASGT